MSGSLSKFLKLGYSNDSVVEIVGSTSHNQENFKVNVMLKITKAPLFEIHH